LKYLSSDAILWAIKQLKRDTHPFIGITFLACKMESIPIGDTASISLDSLTKSHLERHHRASPQSEFYFQPFKGNKYWVAPKYPSSGLQAINTQTFSSSFIHPKNSRKWGFVDNYVDEINDVIASSSGHELTSLLALSIWTGKSRAWHNDDSLDTVNRWFLSEYAISQGERNKLFTETINPTEIVNAFEATEVDLELLTSKIEPPPDAPSETEGTLAQLKLSEVGPASSFEVSFGSRLTVIAGDNGLGKSFLLDAAWWAITGVWPGKAAFPFFSNPKQTKPSLEFGMRSSSNNILLGSSSFDWSNHSWVPQGPRPSVSALCIYAQVDGSFSVFDKTRARTQVGNQAAVNKFSSNDAWNGKPGQIEGLIRDWVGWQLADDQEVFSMLKRVIEHLSPEDLGDFTPSEPVRIPGDPRRMPTLRHRYGDVPIVYSSAGVQRILLLAYQIIWSWQEHILAAEQVGDSSFSKIVIILDELEAHLHPKWQRLILPALMSIGKLLSENLEMQVIVATHSPLVLASIEGDFSHESDILNHLTIRDSKVVLEPLTFQKYGDISSWLTSPVFGLQHARSRDGEKAIESAKKIQLSETQNTEDVHNASKVLLRYLSPEDPFWPRWTFFAKKFGVDL
jgi:hypothetical protein